MRRKRYYHKTIVLKSVFGNTTVFAVTVLCAVAMLISLFGKFPVVSNRNIVMHAFDTVLGKHVSVWKMPTVYDRIAELIPVIQASKERMKALSAQNGGVEKKEITQSESIGSTAGEIKSMDMSAKGISFRNETGYTPDVAENLNRALSFLTKQGAPQVLVIHTHTSEAYAESEGARSTDNTKNVVRVGSVLTETLKQNGISVLHDETRNDYPSYNGSYSKAMAGIEKHLEKHPSIQVVLDVHRDYAEQTKDGKTVQLKPVAEVNGQSVAQVMFVIGTDGLGLTHPNWKENLAFAVQIQQELNQMSPNIARPINLRRERFNQHLTKGSMIIEVGTAGNTIEECERAAAYVGNAIAVVLGKYAA